MEIPLLLNAFFVSYIYPFLLVFTLVFAILEKSKILGDGKKQIDAIVSLVIALIFVTFGTAVGIVNQLMPFLAVLLVIILVFYLMMGFIWGGEKGFEVPKGVKYAGAFVVFIALVVAVVVITGYWGKVVDVFTGKNSWASLIFFVVLIVAALVAVLWKNKE